MTILATAEVILEGNTAAFRASMNEAEGVLRQVGNRMNEVGAEITTRITLPLVGAGTAAIHTAADFDASMRKIAALTIAPQGQVDSWRAQVRQLAIQYGSTGEEAANALYFITSAGITGSRAMDALTASLKGSAIGLGSAQTIAEAATSAMNAYAKTGLTATRATEILAAGVKYGKFQVDALAPSLGRVTGMAAALKIPFTDVISTMAVFSHTGTEAEEAATQLSQVMSTLLEHNKESVKALAAHGLSLQALRNEAAGPGGLINVLRTLDKAFGGNTDQLRLVIPNIRAFRGVINALAQDSKFVDMTIQGVNNSVGTLDDAFKKSQGPAFLMKQAWAQIKDSLITAGNVLIPIIVPAIKDLAQKVADAVTWFSKLSPFVQHSTIMFAGFFAALGPGLLLFGGLTKITGGFIGALAGLPIILLKVITSVVNLGFGLRSLAMYLVNNVAVAFNVASAAGTGFQGVIAVLTPAFAPFLAGAAIILGLGIIAVKWLEMKQAITDTTAAMKDAVDQQNAMFKDTDPATAAKKVQVFDAEIAKLQANLDQLTGSYKKAIIGQAAVAEGTAVGTQKTTENAAAIRVHVDALQETIARMTQVRDILKGVADAYAATNPPVTTTTAAVKTQATWIDAAAEALGKLKTSLAEVSTRQEFLGPLFNANEARIKALTDVVDALVAAGVPLDAVLDTNGTTLRKLGVQLLQATQSSDEFKNAQKALDAQMEHANSLVSDGLTPWEKYFKSTTDIAAAAARGRISFSQAAEAIGAAHDKLTGMDKEMERAHELVESARTPQQKYNDDIKSLTDTLAIGKINQEQYNAAVKAAQGVLDGTTKMSAQLNQAMKDIVGQGVSTFVDSIFGAKQSFGDFVKSALADIAKLIIKLELMKVLFPASSGGKFLGGIMGFATGGVMSPGQVGLVGERGPELIQAGRSGLSVTPMPAMASSGASASSDAGSQVHVHLNVNAIDQRSSAQWIAENEGALATTFLRAVQRSSSLRRQLGVNK